MDNVLYIKASVVREVLRDIFADMHDDYGPNSYGLSMWETLQSGMSRIEEELIDECPDCGQIIARGPVLELGDHPCIGG